MKTRSFLFFLLVTMAAPAGAAQISGIVSDQSGGALSGARVVVRDIASSAEIVTESGSDGRYTVDTAGAGTFLVLVTRDGFSSFTRTLIVDDASARIDQPVVLELGVLSMQVTVTPARSERDVRQVPLHVETLPQAAMLAANPLSTGDAISGAISVTPVGNGPFGVRPRLRGLDSTRLLILVDGERLNTARTATERAGTEVGLVAADAIDRIEVVNGAGSLMYGTDALAGTVNIITNEPTFSAERHWLYGFTGYYSSNENGRRGTLTLGATAPKYAVRVQGGVERYDDYTAGALDVEDTRPFFASGQLRRADTVDQLGFQFRAFPDPFNAPYVRTDALVPSSSSQSNFINASGLVKLSDRRSLRVRYQRRRVEDTGFPDFTSPYFFNVVRLPFSNHDKVSARYEARAITPWLANLTATAYYQRQERLLENTFPVQFPAPTPQRFFPISVFRLDIRSETEQRVWTPGVDVQAVFLPAKNHLLTTGATVYRDRSSDRRRTETTTSQVGQVALSALGMPTATVFPRPIVLGPASVSNPVRVPNATFRDIGLFAQDEWRLRPELSLVAGLRGDVYTVDMSATPGYDVSSIIAGAIPAIDQTTLPVVSGASYTRKALTGDVGLVASPNGRVSPFVRFGRSYRHPNLEELLFAGPATVGSVIPNVQVEPEKGSNFDVGAKFRAGRVSGGAFAFVNQYSNFIASELVVARTSAGPLAQATNFADVRIHGVELQADAPVVLPRGVLTLSGATALMRGTITDGKNPLDGSSLADTPADNITPSKVVTNVRFTDTSGRWWVEYGTRTQGHVDRVAKTLLESPFLIAQDLLSLDGFTVQRLGGGIRVSSGPNRAHVTIALENLGNRYYREHFQFAPARGRSVTIGLRVGAF